MEFTNYFFIEWFISVVSFFGRTTDPFRFPLATSMRPLDGGGSMCTRVVTRHPCPEREWRIIDCSKDHRLVCSIHQPCGSQLEVYVHLLKSGLPMSTHLSPPPRDWTRKRSNIGGRKWKNLSLSWSLDPRRQRL